MISESESIAIKYIRVGSMLAIVICHVLNAYANRWAYVFNIGVQVFLILSGYLYGKKIIPNWKLWSVGRVKRVYVPMFVFLIVVLPFYLIFHREGFLWGAYALNFLNLQGIPFATGGETVQGIRHLWFITAIMFAYLVTPVLQKYRRYSDWLFPLLLACVAISYFAFPGGVLFLASWVYLYAIGYLYVNLKKTRAYDVGFVLVEIVLVVYMVFNFNLVTQYYNPVNRAFHDMTGIFIVVVGVMFMSHLKLKTVPKIVDVFDKYSFHIFLVHYIFVVGPFSMAHITPYVFVNVMSIIVATIVATFLFVKLSDLANKLVFDKIWKVK